MRGGIEVVPGVAAGTARILVVFGRSGGGVRERLGPAIADGTSIHGLVLRH
jgi:hypothetical protein